jgi:ketosteroid isomerase-like protein
MIEQHAAHSFTEQWIDAWNSHDLDKILSHYTDDFIMESPLALKRLPETGGVVKGKEAVRAYWKMGLELIPDLFFEVYEVLVGVNGITIYYINHATGRKTAEVLFLNNEGKAYKGFAYYN